MITDCLKKTYYRTSEVARMLNKTESVIIHTCNNNNLRIKRSKGNLRLFTDKDINKLWRLLYNEGLEVKSVERIGKNYQLILS